jgi:SAM-dependent methyltransferase
LPRIHRAWLDSLPAGLPQRRIDILALGVTPEIALFPWAPDFRHTAIDASEDMIRSVWPGDTSQRQAVLGNWLDLPFADASFDLIVTDTGLALIVGVEKLRAAANELRRVLRKDGRMAMRHFARPSSPETLEAIVQAAETGQLHNFHELKLRLLMAVESSTPETGVRLADVHACFQRLFPDRALLAGRLGCDPRTVSAIDTYQDRGARYAFHSLTDLAQAFAEFILVPGPPGRYPAANICPVFSLTPKP